MTINDLTKTLQVVQSIVDAGRDIHHLSADDKNRINTALHGDFYNLFLKLTGSHTANDAVAALFRHIELMWVMTQPHPDDYWLTPKNKGGTA